MKEMELPEMMILVAGQTVDVGEWEEVLSWQLRGYQPQPPTLPVGPFSLVDIKICISLLVICIDR